MKEPVYITTTLPYINADPHIGFTWEIIQADVLARYLRLGGQEVFFNTGTDEHGKKISDKAKEHGLSPQVFADQLAVKFLNLKNLLNLTFDNFIRTTDPKHQVAVFEFWRRSLENGDIYKKNYRTKYCVGCELEKTDSELVDGRCEFHPDKELEIIEEENYFFRLSHYQQPLLDFYKKNPNFVRPAKRYKEVITFVEAGLNDFSISRLKAKMPWGIDVPGDSDHVIYVWFDALINYISALGWPKDEISFNKWWPAIQFAGKDNLRQQSVMWPAMLISAGLELPREINIHGFVTVGGQKMSKSLGNVVSPESLVSDYGADAVRYYFTREVSSFEDSDFTADRFKAVYNANLANGLGNLASRILKMATTYLDVWPAQPKFFWPKEFEDKIAKRDFAQAADIVWTQIAKLDWEIADRQPFKQIKTNPQGAKKEISRLVQELHLLTFWLEPFVPVAADKIKQAINNHQMIEPLFARKD